MKKKICFVVAVLDTAQAFLRDHIEALSKDYDIYLAGNICKSDEDSIRLLSANSTISNIYHLDIERGISIWRDIKAIWQTFRYFQTTKFDAVHSITPKAGLVTAVAGWLAGVKHRTHIFTGQVWATRNGFSRWILKSIDKLIASLDNHILVDGMSQKVYLEKEGVLKREQAQVFGDGSISGVNSVRFAPNASARQSIRSELGIKEDILCYIFMGRLNHDKGINELYAAFNHLASEIKDVFLLIVGKDEDNFSKRLSFYPNIIAGKNFNYYGVTAEPEKVFNAGDVFILPTYREGFGSSVLEAASVGLPCICSDAYGVLDSYVENETGLRCHVGDTDSLYNCMREMYNNPIMRKQMGERARQRAIRDFNGARLTKCWVEFYQRILK